MGDNYKIRRINEHLISVEFSNESIHTILFIHIGITFEVNIRMHQKDGSLIQFYSFERLEHYKYAISRSNYNNTNTMQKQMIKMIGNDSLEIEFKEGFLDMVKAIGEGVNIENFSTNDESLKIARLIREIEAAIN